MPPSAANGNRTGWNDFYLRSYDAQTGLWTKADPYDQFASPYIGMGNDPVNGVDPNGGFFDLIKNLLTGEVFDDKSIVGESAFLNSAYNNGNFEYLGEGEAKFLPGISITGGINWSQVFAPWKFTSYGIGTGLGMGVLNWVQNTARTSYNWSMVGLLTTPPGELEKRAYALRSGILNTLEFATLPDYAKGQLIYNYAATKIDNFVNSTPYDQGRTIGGILPDVALTVLAPELRAVSGEGLAAKTGTNTIYRVVSNGEAADVLANGFRQAPISSKIASYEGKLFWTNMKDAKWYHNWVGEGNQILKIRVNKGFIFENGADAGRQFYYVSPDRLNQFNSAIKSIR